MLSFLRGSEVVWDRIKINLVKKRSSTAAKSRYELTESETFIACITANHKIQPDIFYCTVFVSRVEKGIYSRQGKIQLFL